jgi:1-deoxy-D-xylulose-5-phosphate synthase
LGLPYQFIEHVDPAELMAMQGLDAAGIEKAISNQWPDIKF